MEQILLDQEHCCQELLGVGLLLASKTACHSNQIVTGSAHSVSDVLFCFWLEVKLVHRKSYNGSSPSFGSKQINWVVDIEVDRL